MIESIIAQIFKLFKLEKYLNLDSARERLLRSFYPILLVLSVLVAFLGGRVSKLMENKPSFTMETVEATFLEEKAKMQGINQHIEQIVASKGGKKYYFVWCKGAENIKEKNKRYFKNEEDAKSAGLVLAGSCK